VQVKVFNFTDRGPTTHQIKFQLKLYVIWTNVNLKRKLGFVTSFLKFLKFIFLEGRSHSSSHFQFR
jgi:hypothetical protein